jgi:hypothetical protein
VLGIFALSAVILAAIAFAAVDVTLANSSGDSSIPVGAMGFAVIGTISLLVSVLPAISWFVQTVDHTRHDADIEPMAMAIVRTTFDEDEL